MDNKNVAYLLVATLALAWGGPAAAQQRKAPAQPARAAAPPPCVPGEPAFWRDQAVTTKVAARLQFHKPLLREHVEVKVTGGAAILSGNMSSQELIDEAVRTVRDMGGVQCVQSYLKVGPPLRRDPQQEGTGG